MYDWIIEADAVRLNRCLQEASGETERRRLRGLLDAKLKLLEAKSPQVASMLRRRWLLEPSMPLPAAQTSA